MAATHTFFLEHIIASPPESVYAALVDLRQFGRYHPHMKEVRIVDDQKPAFIEYEISEELILFKIFRSKPRYNARVFEIDTKAQLRYTSQVKPGIFLQVDFKLKNNGKEGTLISEQVQLTCLKPLALAFYGILKKAHLEAFENLKQQLKERVDV